MSAPTVPATELAASYRQAAEVIATGGLCKRHFHDSATGAHCTIGALQVARGDGVEYERSVLAPIAVLGLGIEERPCDCGCGTSMLNPFTEVTRWNDRDETTAEDVVELLTRTADKLEAQS